MGDIISFEPATDVHIGEVRCAVQKILDFWPAEIVFSGKKFGPAGEYGCETLKDEYVRVARLLDNEDLNDLEGIAEVHVGAAIKSASKFIKRLRVEDIDAELIIMDICARDDLNI